jgi:antitoxin component YwqK of YwqJK toxin-antitoxin module
MIKTLKRLIVVGLLFLTMLIIVTVIRLNNNSIKEKESLLKINGLLYKNGSKSPFTGIEKSKVRDRILEYDVVNGIKNGRFKVFYSDGTLQISGQLINDKNEGLWQYFYTNAQLESQGDFKNDLPTGSWYWYFPDGKIKEEGVFIEGKREGKWVSYKENGQVDTEKNYENGETVASRNLN